MTTNPEVSTGRLKPSGWVCLLICGFQAGCAVPSGGREILLDLQPTLSVAAPRSNPGILPCVAVEPAAKTDEPTAPCIAFAGVAELLEVALVEQVLARNPTLAQMVAAWQAATARYPQVTALDDPMFGVAVTPAIFSDRVDGGYRMEFSQKLPWCGKLALRGEQALAEANAAGNNIDAARLQLIESARNALFDYYLVARALEVNAENLKLLREAREAATSRYTKGLVPQQDIFQADVEIGLQQERQLTLERMRQVAVARINTLLHLPPDLPLPPPPRRLAPAGPLPEVQALREAARQRRPDLSAVANRLAADQAALGQAHKEFYPDIELMAGYNALWQEKTLQPIVGVRVNLPVRLERRNAAVTEAWARVAERLAELARRTDQVNFEVQQAYAQVQESDRTIGLFEKTILPAAREHVEAAQAAYAAGSVPFLSWVTAQRNQVGLRDRYYEAIANSHRRRAALERAIGGPLDSPPMGSPPTYPKAFGPGETAPLEELPKPRPVDNPPPDEVLSKPRRVGGAGQEATPAAAGGDSSPVAPDDSPAAARSS